MNNLFNKLTVTALTATALSGVLTCFLGLVALGVLGVARGHFRR